ncbi:hypothetical protein A3754_17960 [Alcanivorax sp. HI0083]|mgnify:CR=1 FL=1|nr:DUF488 domain-containing protein [Alcanivorax sp. HI0083]KZY35602.1 hypothetical protein A3730_02560 [Alcanivorax sp. HI0044]KZZ23755.1 hypothetical protein A3754_17960 [Alcanivorax sp. HI0083]
MSSQEFNIHCKRAYQKAAPDDGYRILIDRLWPRGVSKDELKIDEWNKALAPSDDLRKWFDHDPKKWAAFYQKYHRELRENLPHETRQALRQTAKDGRLTLVYGARDEAHNNAVALKMYLQDSSNP